MPYRSSKVTVGLTTVPILPADPKRIAIIFSPPNGNRATVGTDPGMVDLGGIQLAANSQSISVDRARHGDLPGAAWYGIGNVASVPVGIIEVW